MEMLQDKELLLGSPNELQEYIEKLSLTSSQLRFPSVTSINRRFAVIIVVYNAQTDSVLLVSYNTRKSHLKKVIEIDDAIVDRSENTFGLLRTGLADETGLSPLRIKALGLDPISVPNTYTDAESFFHDKYPMLVDDFMGTLKTPEMMLSEKNEELIWVKVSLVGQVFNQLKYYPGSEVPKTHPQLEVYDRFMAYYEGSMRV